MKFIKISLVIIWMTIIFMFSNQPATESSKLSDGIILKTVRIIESINHKKYNDEDILNNFVKPVRKLAHFSIYLILGVLVYISLKDYSINKLVVSLLICIIYALSDEIHQLFVLGRSGEFLDVCIDSIGSFIGIYIVKEKLK